MTATLQNAPETQVLSHREAYRKSVCDAVLSGKVPTLEQIDAVAYAANVNPKDFRMHMGAARLRKEALDDIERCEAIKEENVRLDAKVTEMSERLEIRRAELAAQLAEEIAAIDGPRQVLLDQMRSNKDTLDATLEAAQKILRAPNPEVDQARQADALEDTRRSDQIKHIADRIYAVGRDIRDEIAHEQARGNLEGKARARELEKMLHHSHGSRIEAMSREREELTRKLCTGKSNALIKRSRTDWTYFPIAADK